MVTRLRSQGSGARRVSRGRPVAPLFGAIAVTALALFGGSLASAPAQAAQVCGDRGQILKQLEQGHAETRRALGLSADGGVLEILVSPQGGWTMLVTYPKRPTCVIAVGEAWQSLQLAGEPA